MSTQRDELQARLAKVETAAAEQAQQFERRQAQAAERFDRAEARLLAQVDAAKGEAKQLKARLSEQAKQTRAAEAAANQAITAVRQEAIDLRQQLEVKAALLHEREHDCGALRAQAEAQGTELASTKAQLDHARLELTASRDECRKLAGTAQKDATCIQRLREQVVELQTRLDMGSRGVKPKKPRGKKANQST
ncbi:MAG TPA: hypothetical protein VFL54_08490 [Gammaproteobacteria bacterium]|nr:hypothetical protein [Gammaproteobacteria bacterium]